MRRYYDLLRGRPDAEMEALAREWDVELLESVENIGIARTPKEARALLTKKAAVFVPSLDEALLSLAKQQGTMLGFFTADINYSNLRNYMEWVRLAQKAGVAVLIASGARELREMRSPRDRARMGMLLGMRKENAFAAVGHRWRALLEAHA